MNAHGHEDHLQNTSGLFAQCGKYPKLLLESLSLFLWSELREHRSETKVFVRFNVRM